VTGGSSGIGRETVRALAAAGCANVLLCARNVAAGQIVADEVNRASKADVVRVVELDLADLDSVKQAANGIKREHSGIDLLVLNAGVMMCVH
jgi:NAD(P)-dependent dehydrogenase (short-subunit alcohol dehydrogenase family)